MLDCGSSSILIISNTDGPFPASFSLNGGGGVIGPETVYNVPCRGTIDTGTAYTLVTFKVMPSVNPTVNFSAPFSLLAGMIVALVFVVMSLRKA